ncbi:uncharacterized protein LOC144294164 isoform X2 [Canis aureus]
MPSRKTAGDYGWDLAEDGGAELCSCMDHSPAQFPLVSMLICTSWNFYAPIMQPTQENGRRAELEAFPSFHFWRNRVKEVGD